MKWPFGAKSVLSALDQHFANMLELGQDLHEELVRLVALGQPRDPITCSVLVLPSEPDIGVLSWTGKLAAGEERLVQLIPYRPIPVGAWVIGLNGALVSALRVGDMAQDAGGVFSIGPVYRLIDPVPIGLHIFFRVQTDSVLRLGGRE